MVFLIEILNGTHETATYRSMSGVRAFVNRDAEDFPLHWHTALEIIRPVENEYTVKTNGKTVTFYPGDILLIPPGELHALFAPADGERLILQFDYSLFTGLDGMDFLLHALRPCLLICRADEPDAAASLSGLLHDILREYSSDDPFREASVRSLLLRFFVILGRTVVTEAGKFPEFSPSKQQEYIEKFANPYVAASKGFIDSVIEPKETRSLLLHALKLSIMKEEYRPAKKHGLPPF